MKFLLVSSHDWIGSLSQDAIEYAGTLFIPTILDWALTMGFQLCRTLNQILTTNSVISLHHLLLCNALRLNPAVNQASPNSPHAPLSSAHLLSTLRERLARFRNFIPRQQSSLEMEPGGSLYEYLEGVLLRGRRTGGELSRELTVYDLRKLGEWEDTPLEETVGTDASASEEIEETTESEAAKGLRTKKRFDFEIAEFAVDPGADLLVLAEVR